MTGLHAGARELVERRAALLLLLVIASVAVYLNSLASGFALDDVPIIQENARVHNLANLRDIWFTPYWPFFGVELGLWRPFAIFAYAVQWAIGNGEPVVFHAVSIGLHAGVTVLVFLLLERLTAAVPALAGALVFAVHPVHTEAVANVVGQAELIVAAALIGACLVHANRPAGIAVPWPRRLAVVGLFAIALLTKEHAVVLPGLLVITDFAQRRVRLTGRGLTQYVGAMIIPVLMLAAALSLFLIFRFQVLEGNVLGIEAGPQLHYLREEYRVLNALRAFPELLRLLFFPLSLSADYAPAMILPVESLTGMVVVGGLLLGATAVLALLTPWNPLTGFAAAWFLVSVSTVSNLFFPIGVLVAERTLYLASVAVSALVAYGWMAAAARLSGRGRRLATILLVAILVAGGVRTWIRNPDWRSTEAILHALMRDHPMSYRAQWTAATREWRLGNHDAARFRFEMALRIYPRDSQLMAEFAEFLLGEDRIERAVELLERAYALHSFVPRTSMLLGMGYLATERYEDAMRVAREAETRGLAGPSTMALRAAAWDGLGDSGRALATWRSLIRTAQLEPPVSWAYLARTLARRAADDDANDALRRGRDAAPGDTAFSRLLDDMRAAIAAGCYVPDSATGQPGTVVPDAGSCDPLGAAAASVQNAAGLQNARRTLSPLDR